MEIKDFACPVKEIPQGSILGIVINYDKIHKSFHLGLSYNLNEGINIIHLAFHNDLEYNNHWENFSTWIKPNIHPYIQESISAFCQVLEERIKNGDVKIPYGFSYVKDTIFDIEGNLQLAQGESGLTCATFVLTVFNTNGIVLIDSDNWPTREEDIEWASNFLCVFKHIKPSGCYEITKEHIDKLKGEIGCKRFRPQEVAISSVLYDIKPASSEAIIQIGKELESYMANL